MFSSVMNAWQRIAFYDRSLHVCCVVLTITLSYKWTHPLLQRLPLTLSPTSHPFSCPYPTLSPTITHLSHFAFTFSHPQPPSPHPFPTSTLQFLLYLPLTHSSNSLLLFSYPHLIPSLIVTHFSHPLLQPVPILNPFPHSSSLHPTHPLQLTFLLTPILLLSYQHLPWPLLILSFKSSHP